MKQAFRYELYDVMTFHWETIDDYYSRLEKKGVNITFTLLVPHLHRLRNEGLIESRKRKLSEEELEDATIPLFEYRKTSDGKPSNDESDLGLQPAFT